MVWCSMYKEGRMQDCVLQYCCSKMTGEIVVERNPGIPLDLGWVNSAAINKSAVERRAASIPAKRSVKKAHQAAWLLRGVTCIDLTTLAGDDTDGNVHRLCAKAKNPIREDILTKLNLSKGDVRVGAVCVYPNMVKKAVEYLKGSNIPVASVAAGFPAGQIPIEEKVAEIRQAVRDGAQEIDIVVSRGAVLTGDWARVYSEIKACREACGEAHLKTILATGELATYENVYKASLVAMMAGSDVIKTSTGKESVNATLPVSLVMARAIRDYFERTGYIVGFKPAGGIRSARQVLDWFALMMDELGEEWTHPNLFRFGASGLLTDIERQLWHHVSGQYAAGYYMPMG